MQGIMGVMRRIALWKDPHFGIEAKFECHKDTPPRLVGTLRGCGPHPLFVAQALTHSFGIPRSHRGTNRGPRRLLDRSFYF
jgi:hypothetical protein